MEHAPELVVVVDDDEAVRRALTFSLQLEGLEVEAYESGDHLLTSIRPDIGCLVVDFRMPGMDGITLIERLREIGREPPAILIASKLDPSLQARATAAGIDLVLEKPLEDAALIDGIKAALARPRAVSGTILREGA
ncbi:response regulator transcription factor [Salinarimonas sp. NSM]|uniref:response regulator transcription factor n=1 Tax=Salinarimonas sp. NSM TaxID=3458003 RepID=UPI0040371BC2